MEEIELLNNAFKIYNLNGTPDLPKMILNYILSRLIANKENFEQMIEMLKADISFNDILNAFNEAYRENDLYNKNTNYKQGTDYYSGVFPMPIGNIVVETNNVLEVVKYFVRGIISRNTITISQTEYYELSLSNMVLIIFVEALSKFNISRNTLMIMPFEECLYENFDEVIEVEKWKSCINQKGFSTKNIIYVEDNSFDFEINLEKERLKEQNINFEIIEGTLENALNIIKKEKPKGVAIYTKNPHIAHDFIVLANSQNVFVNSSLLNSEELNDKINKLYYKKKVMYPSGKEINLEEYYKEYTDKFIKIKMDVFSKEDDGKKENTQTALVEIINPWYKRIFEKIKNLFLKK